MADLRLRRDIVWNLVPVVLLGAVGLGMNFLIGGWWGAAALGVFNQVTVAYFVVSVIAAAGIQYSVLRMIAERPADREHVASAAVGALLPTLVLGSSMWLLFVVISGPVGHWVDSSDVSIGMLWAGPGLLCFALNKVLLGIVNGLRRMRAFAIYTSLRYLLLALGLLIARLVHVPQARLAAIWTFAEGVLFIVLCGELIATVQLRAAARWRDAMRSHLRYGLRGVLATLAFEINSKLDVWLLGVAMSDRVVGIYSLAAALWEGVMQLAVVVQNNINPVLALDLAQQRTAEIEVFARRVRRWFVPGFIAVAAVAAALYPATVPRVIGNPDFMQGAAPFAILVAGAALCAPYLPFQQILLMAALPGFQTIYVTIVLVTNCAINLVLVPVLGTVGAAIASASALAMSALLLRFMVRRQIGARV